MRSVRFAIVCIALSSLCPISAHAADPRIEGLWFGKELNRKPVNGILHTVLLIQQDKLVVISGQGVFASALQCSPDAQLPELELGRYDGQKQYGVYRVVGAELRMTLANPGKARPSGEAVENAGGVPHSHYVFHRVPTKEGLEVLKYQLRSDEIHSQVTEQSHALAAAAGPVANGQSSPAQ